MVKNVYRSIHLIRLNVILEITMRIQNFRLLKSKVPADFFAHEFRHKVARLVVAAISHSLARYDSFLGLYIV